MLRPKKTWGWIAKHLYHPLRTLFGLDLQWASHLRMDCNGNVLYHFLSLLCRALNAIAPVRDHATSNESVLCAAQWAECRRVGKHK